MGIRSRNTDLLITHSVQRSLSGTNDERADDVFFIVRESQTQWERL